MATCPATSLSMVARYSFEPNFRPAPKAGFTRSTQLLPILRGIRERPRQVASCRSSRAFAKRSFADRISRHSAILLKWLRLAHWSLVFCSSFAERRAHSWLRGSHDSCAACPRDRDAVVQNDMRPPNSTTRESDLLVEMPAWELLILVCRLDRFAWFMESKASIRISIRMRSVMVVCL